jgi:hypothetical protein
MIREINMEKVSYRFSHFNVFFIILIIILPVLTEITAQKLSANVEQITFGPQNHFFGYIGHVQTIPWNKSGRYIVSLEVPFRDHMPAPTDAAVINLIDTKDNYKLIPVDKTYAWNFQQGTMLYWNPEAPETQFFFNDRDTSKNHIFVVLYDIEKRKRIREFKFDDTPIGNSGVAQNGGYFLGINYGRLARLRTVTGYPGAFDWTTGIQAPDNDGVFLVNVNSGEKKLLVSYKQLSEVIKHQVPAAAKDELFINHTLWNREDDLIYFYLRAGYLTREKTVNNPFTIKPDGTELTAHPYYGGHPEWIENDCIIGSHGKDQIIYSIPERKIVGKIGTPEILPKTGGDTSLSPDGKWLAVSLKNDKDGENTYVVFRRSDMLHIRTPKMPTMEDNNGDLRVDPAPRWNRTSDALLVPGVVEDGTRQLFIISIKENLD